MAILEEEERGQKLAWASTYRKRTEETKGSERQKSPETVTEGREDEREA